MPSVTLTVVHATTAPMVTRMQYFDLKRAMHGFRVVRRLAAAISSLSRASLPRMIQRLFRRPVISSETGTALGRIGHILAVAAVGTIEIERAARARQK